MPLQQANLSGDIAALTNQLESYRNSPRKQRQLPESLWAQAAKLARHYGVGRVQRALRLNYYNLKQRVAALSTPALEPVRAIPKNGPPAFVEFRVPPTASVPPAAVIVEVEDRTGRKLTVRLAAAQGGEVVALARALWSGRP